MHNFRKIIQTLEIIWKLNPEIFRKRLLFKLDNPSFIFVYQKYRGKNVLYSWYYKVFFGKTKTRCSLKYYHPLKWLKNNNNCRNIWNWRPNFFKSSSFHVGTSSNFVLPFAFCYFAQILKLYNKSTTCFLMFWRLRFQFPT